MIEINGLFNIHILLEQRSKHDLVVIGIKEQLDLLERYMIAFADSTQKGEKPPYWHEVKGDPSKYKLNRER